VSRNPALGRGAYRDRHERGPGGGGRRWHRREEVCRAESREQGRRAHDRCDRRTAKSCGPGARGLASSLAVMWRPDRVRASIVRKATGAIVQRSPGRARHKPSNHCAGKAGMSPVALFSAMHEAHAVCSWHGGPWEPTGSRPSLRPLSIDEGEATRQNSGETSREDAMLCPHEGEYVANPMHHRHPEVRALRRDSVPRRATAPPHQLARASFEAPHAMHSHRMPRTSG